MKRAKQLETIISIILGLSVILLISKNKNVLISIIILASIGLFSTYLTGKIHFLWTKFSEILGGIMSKVILSLLFFLFLFPIALLSRLFTKKDALQLKRTTEPTYYTTRNHLYTAEDLENPW